MRTDTDMLKRKISDSGKSPAQVSDEIGIDKSSFYRKLRTGKFTVGEAQALTECIPLSLQEAMNIFFAPEVA